MVLPLQATITSDRSAQVEDESKHRTTSRASLAATAILMLVTSTGCAESDTTVNEAVGSRGATASTVSTTQEAISTVAEPDPTTTSPPAGGLPDGDFADAEHVHETYRQFDFQSDQADQFTEKVGRFYGVDGRLASRVVGWAVWHSPGTDGRSHVLVQTIEDVVTSDVGTSGIVELVDSSGSRLPPIPFWAPPRGELLISVSDDGAKPEGLGPELTLGPDTTLPDEGVLLFDQGTVAMFTADGLAVGHLPREGFAGGAGSLADWLTTSGHRVQPMSVVSGDYPCFTADDVGRGELELCAAGDDLVPSITLDGVPLITEEHWAAFYQESGWDWAQARSTGSPVAGHYRTADWDPISDAWLLAWSGECETTDALLFRDDRLSHVTGQSWEAAPSSTALGFIDGAAVFITSPTDAASCGTGADPAAVYAVTPGDEPVMIWSSSDSAVQAVAFGR